MVVESISLQLLKPLDIPVVKIEEEEVANPTFSSGTLIIAPAAIIDQWVSEATHHAPSLRFHVYEGVNSPNAMTVAELKSFDLVFTSYEILRKEIHSAKAAPNRARRFYRRYKRERSPLVRIKWWRGRCSRLCQAATFRGTKITDSLRPVVLDEAQMVESSVSQAAGNQTARQHSNSP